GNGDTRSSYITAKKLISELDALAHSEDVSGRYTTQAINRDKAMDQNEPSNLTDDHASIGWKSDVAAWNVYPGWYNDSNFAGTFQEVADRKAAQDSRPMALSEYGWGGSVSQHELYPKLGKNGLTAGGKWHPEEYQSLMHEQAIEYINENASLWGVYVWSLFDFDVDSRNEGARIAQNDKGLITNDRKIKKDSFYLYKANWDKRAPFVHITSSRFSERESSKTYVKVYSNCSGVELFVNGESKGAMKNIGSGVFKIDGIDLSVVCNTIRAVGAMDDENAEDSCVWTRL
ncbi:MAG: DUF4982 domain-containing protein, partial [Candidatus Ornithomonoglobus sp.]